MKRFIKNKSDLFIRWPWKACSLKTKRDHLIDYTVNVSSEKMFNLFVLPCCLLIFYKNMMKNMNELRMFAKYFNSRNLFVDLCLRCETREQFFKELYLKIPVFRLCVRSYLSISVYWLSVTNKYSIQIKFLPNISTK